MEETLAKILATQRFDVIDRPGVGLPHSCFGVGSHGGGVLTALLCPAGGYAIPRCRS